MMMNKVCNRCDQQQRELRAIPAKHTTIFLGNKRREKKREENASESRLPQSNRRKIYKCNQDKRNLKKKKIK